MPRLNPYALARPGALQESRTFEDPLQPGEVLELTLRAEPGAGPKSQQQEKTQEYIRLYVTGDGEYEKTKESEKPSGKQPAIISLPGGPPVIVTKSLCAVIATLESMETAAFVALMDNDGLVTDWQPYAFSEWAVLSERMPSAFDEAVAWAGGLLLQAEGKAKNALRGILELKPGSPSKSEA